MRSSSSLESRRDEAADPFLSAAGNSGVGGSDGPAEEESSHEEEEEEGERCFASLKKGESDLGSLRLTGWKEVRCDEVCEG